MLYYGIVDGVTSVGALNPNLRIFDVIMKTEYGTSYNSYFVQGTEKTALIETAHKDYLDSLLDNLHEVEQQPKIDYIILNHTEPDHSGSLAKLLDFFPDATIVCSRAASIYLKNITNRTDYQEMVVKDGDTIDLGGKTLRFINAPFLHWPDSMFTYLEEDQILFSCDFLGAHYCEPQVVDTKIAYDDAYQAAFKGYYDAIFGPFPTYVQSGLAKIKNLDIQYVAPSHGPVLTNGVKLEAAIASYQQWSAPVEKDAKDIPVFYCSAYGNTKMLANQIVAGIKEVLPDANVAAYNIIDYDMAEMARKMNASDAFLIGAPTINRDAVAPANVLLANAEAINIAKRPTAVFGSYGWSGEAIGNLRTRLTTLKTNLYSEDCKVIFVPTEEDLEKAKAFGANFAQWITQ